MKKIVSVKSNRQLVKELDAMVTPQFIALLKFARPVTRKEIDDYEKDFLSPLFQKENKRIKERIKERINL